MPKRADRVELPATKHRRYVYVSPPGEPPAADRTPLSPATTLLTAPPAVSSAAVTPFTLA
jgi:hypothetical protein